MEEEHKELDGELDRPLLEDIFDSPPLRYVSIYMFRIRNELFKDLEDDILIEEYNLLMDFKRPTKADVQRLCSPDLIKSLIKFKIISNVSDYSIFKMKPDEFTIAIDYGVKLAHEDISEEEEEIHVFVKEEYLEKLIRADIPEMTRQKIHKALEQMRAMMCPISSIIHELIHKYGEYYVLDDNFYYIIEELGNPYQAIRIELMIRKLSEKYKEIEKELDKYLAIFHPELPKAKIFQKFKKIIELETKGSKTKVKSGAKGPKQKRASGLGDGKSTSKGNGKGQSSQVKPIGEKISLEQLKATIKAQSPMDIEGVDLNSIDFVEKLKERIQKSTLPVKFRLKFSDLEDEDSEYPPAPEIYLRWKETLNNLIRLKLKFEIIDKKMDSLRAFYSGANQIMPYIEFIEKASFNEDNIADTIRDLLVDARNLLKGISDELSKYDLKQIKMLNLDLERAIIENGWDNEDEEEE